MSSLGIQTAMKLAYKGGLIASSNPSTAQYFMVEPLHAFVRFGKWNDILSLPDPDNTYVYAKLMSHFAKGLAFIRTNQPEQAAGQFLKLDSLCKLDTLKSVYFSFNSASEIVQVPLNLLKGELLIAKHKTAEGISFLQKAVEVEDNLRYMEPPDWKIPTRQFLGAALLESGKFTEAEKIYSDDLQRNPENGWSLKGLLLCQEKTGKKMQSIVTAKRFEKAWKNADFILLASRF